MQSKKQDEWCKRIEVSGVKNFSPSATIKMLPLREGCPLMNDNKKFLSATKKTHFPLITHSQSPSGNRESMSRPPSGVPKGLEHSEKP